jgi:hypothetical protein
VKITPLGADTDLRLEHHPGSNATQPRGPLPLTLDTGGVDHLNPRGLERKLVALGVAKPTARTLTDNDPEEVARQLAWLPRRAGIKHRAAAVVTAVRERWPEPIDPRPRPGADRLSSDESERLARQMFPEKFGDGRSERRSES